MGKQKRVRLSVIGLMLLAVISSTSVSMAAGSSESSESEAAKTEVSESKEAEAGEDTNQMAFSSSSDIDEFVGKVTVSNLEHSVKMYEDEDEDEDEDTVEVEDDDDYDIIEEIDESVSVSTYDVDETESDAENAESSESEDVDEVLPPKSYTELFNLGTTWYYGKGKFSELKFNNWDLIYLVKIADHEVGYTEELWKDMTEEKFDHVQSVMIATVPNRAISNLDMFPEDTISGTIAARTYGSPQYMSLESLDYYEPNDPDRTLKNVLAVLYGEVDIPANVFWEGSLEGCGCSGVYEDAWYTTVWNSSMAFGYFDEV